MNISFKVLNLVVEMMVILRKFADANVPRIASDTEPWVLSHLLGLFADYLLLGKVLILVVEMMGFEPMTPCLQGRCSPS